MLKELLRYVASWSNSNSVNSRIKKAMQSRVREAQKRVNEDIEFYKQELNDRLEAALREFVENKEAAVVRQVNAMLTRITQ